MRYRRALGIQVVSYPLDHLGGKRRRDRARDRDAADHQATLTFAHNVGVANDGQDAPLPGRCDVGGLNTR